MILELLGNREEYENSRSAEIMFQTQNDGRMILNVQGTEVQACVCYHETREIISFYIGNVQVGQLTGALASKKEICCLIHFLPEYDDWAPALVRFAVEYYDRKRRNRKKDRNTDLMQVLLSSQNREYYHEDFLMTYFGTEESVRVDLWIEEQSREMMNNMRSEVRHVGVPLILGCIGILAVLLGGLWFLGL